MKRLMEVLTQTQWAVMPQTLRALHAVVRGGALDDSQRKHFHAAAEGSMPQGRPGVIAINGPIIPRATWFSGASGAASIDNLTAQLKEAEADADVDRIVLVIDSPGGAVTGVADFAHNVRNCPKPTTAYVIGMAASAAYWIASAADQIVIAPTALTGGIGTVLTVANDDDESDDTLMFVSSQTPRKRESVKTDEGRAALQEIVDGLAATFLEQVAMYRGLKLEHVTNNFGRGAMLLAAKAVEVGMVDCVSTLQDVLAQKTKPIERESAVHNERETEMDQEKIDAAVKAAVDTAVDTERTRVAGIRELAAVFAEAHPGVRDAVNACVALEAANENATKESTAVKLLEVVAGAQLGVLRKAEEAGQQSAQIAAEFAGAVKTEKEDAAAKEAEEANEKTVSLMAAAIQGDV